MKFNVRDENGKEFEVEEVEEKDETAAGELPKNTPAQTSDSELTPEEITALKSLASVADKLVALVKGDATDDCGDDPMLDEDEDGDEDEDAEVVVKTGDSKPAKKATDAKKSIGAIERKPDVRDSVEADPVADAWAKRYGGHK